MQRDPAASMRERLFKRFRSGDGAALIDLLERERPLLYDYLMRMTGQVSRSFDSVDEVYQSYLEGDAKTTIDDLEELRICLYQTGRKFNADIWNADTARLRNTAIEAGTDGGDGAADDDSAAFQALDLSLRSLRGAEREIVLLRSRCDFEFAAAGEIMGLGEDAAESLFYKGMQRIDADCSGVVERPEQMLTKLPSHPPPEHSAQATMNLSVMMHDIKAKPVGLWSPFRIALVVAVALALGFLAVFPERARQLLRKEPRAAAEKTVPGVVPP
jgi:DNA-directed RNA polymerase specialized sigma24 family protein